MEKTKLLTLTIIGLLILNFAILGFLLLGDPNGYRPPRHGGHRGPQPKEIIIEKLHFDAQQQKKYVKLIQWHRNEIDKLDKNIRRTKGELYAQLSKPEVDVNAKIMLINLLSSYQKGIEQTHFQHFEDIKRLCKPNQMEDYNELTEELARIFAPKPHDSKHE